MIRLPCVKARSSSRTGGTLCTLYTGHNVATGPSSDKASNFGLPSGLTLSGRKPERDTVLSSFFRSLLSLSLYRCGTDACLEFCLLVFRTDVQSASWLVSCRNGFDSDEKHFSDHQAENRGPVQPFSPMNSHKLCRRLATGFAACGLPELAVTPCRACFSRIPLPDLRYTFRDVVVKVPLYINASIRGRTRGGGRIALA